MAQHFLQDWMYAQQRLRTAFAFTHSRQNFCRLFKEYLDDWLPTERKATALISLCLCTDWSVSLLGGHAIMKEMLYPAYYDDRFCMHIVLPEKPPNWMNTRAGEYLTIRIEWREHKTRWTNLWDTASNFRYTYCYPRPFHADKYMHVYVFVALRIFHRAL